MAVLKYMINVDRPNGNAAVTRVITQFGPGITDKICFSSNQPDTAIEFVGASPFTDPKAPQTGVSFKVGMGPTAAFEVKALSKSIRFNCGHENTPGVFTPWGGAGDGTPPDH